MDAATASANLVARDFRCGYGYHYYSPTNSCRRNSTWNYWGRWVVVGIIIFFLFFTLLCCMISRRRRSRGVKPYYGTGWMATPAKPWGNHNSAPNNYNNGGYNMNSYNNGGYPQNPNYQQGYNPPPAYGAQQQGQAYTGQTYNPNEGYYGQQQSGVQAPPQTYQREAFDPPAGPPPGK